MKQAVPLYDPFSADYDRFVNWRERLAYELPFIEQQLAASGARRILDTVCGIHYDLRSKPGRSERLTRMNCGFFASY